VNSPQEENVELTSSESDAGIVINAQGVEKKGHLFD
jgi:hypothetical protein